MKWLVTGGAGFIGSNFVFYMLDKYPEDQIICLDKLTYAGNLETLEGVMENPGFTFVKGDIADREAVYALFEKERPGHRGQLCGGKPCGPLSGGSGYLFADQYPGYRRADGRLPQIRDPALPSGIHR